MKRLFIGIPVSDSMQEKIGSLYSKFKDIDSDMTIVSLENLHITLKYLGMVEENKIPEIIQKLQSVCSAQKTISVSFENIDAFPSSEIVHVIWAGVQELHSSHLTHFMKEVNNTFQYILFTIRSIAKR